MTAAIVNRRPAETNGSVGFVLTKKIAAKEMDIVAVNRAMGTRQSFGSFRRFMTPLTLITLVVLTNATGCRSRPKDPESEIRQMIASAERWAEAEELGELKGLFTADFKGRGRYRKQQLLSMIQFQFLRRQKIFILSKITDIDILADGEAEVELVAALTGRPAESPDELRSLRADLLQFKLGLVRDGKWQIRTAQWQRANLRSLLEATGMGL